MIRFLIATMLILGATAMPRTVLAEGRISVTGTGTVEAEPDMASLRIGVMQQADTAAAAMAEASARTAAVLSRLAGLGVENRDMQTSGFSVHPVWNSRPNRQGETVQEVTGFVARNGVMVQVRDLDGLGMMLDAAVGDGANDLGGISFEVAEPAALLDAARRKAVVDAMARAQLYAEAAGVSLGPVISISEPGGHDVGRPMMEMAMARDTGAPVARGQVSYSASVTMVFAIGE